MKVQGAVDRYIQSICSLSATIGVHLLENQEELLQLQKKQLALLKSLHQSFEDEQIQAKKEKVLKWLYDGDPWERYSELKRGRSRFANSGTWFLESLAFIQWFTGETQSLICWGARTSSSLIVTDLWLAGAGKSFITFVGHWKASNCEELGSFMSSWNGRFPRKLVWLRFISTTSKSQPNILHKQCNRLRIMSSHVYSDNYYNTRPYRRRWTRLITSG